MIHYKFNPSGSERWLHCGPSAGVPGESNDAADFGTWCHDEAADWNLNGPPRFCDPEVERMIAPFCNHVAEERKRLGGEYHVEVHIISDIPDHGGTIDVLIVTDDAIHIYDLKTGFKTVRAFENTQMGCYLNLAREKFPGRKRFYATIIQPRFDVIEEEEFSREWLDELRDRVKDVVTQTKYNPGPHCEHCPLLGVCKIVRDRARELAMSEPDTVAEWKEVVQFSDVYEKLVGEGKKVLMDEIRSGRPVEGFKIAQKWGNRKWIDEDLASKALAENGLPVDMLYEDPALKSPAQIEKAAKADGVPIDLSILVTKGEPYEVLTKASSRLRTVHHGEEFGD